MGRTVKGGSRHNFKGFSNWISVYSGQQSGTSSRRRPVSSKRCSGARAELGSLYHPSTTQGVVLLHNEGCTPPRPRCHRGARSPGSKGPHALLECYTDKKARDRAAFSLLP